MDNIIIIGCGGHAKSVVDVLLLSKPDIKIIIVDEKAQANEHLFEYPILNKIPITENVSFFLCIGDNLKRKNKMLSMNKKHFVSIISPLAHLGKNSIIDPGTFIANYVHIGPYAHIGKNTIINTGCIIEHDVEIGCHCHIAPNSTISGKTELGNEIFVGTGATIINNITICSNVTIGAGAVVTKSITEPGTYVGCPVRKIR
jgi:UDP-N-acetylbacillosamine N-acetyltransferase